VNLTDTAADIDQCAAWINGDEPYNPNTIAATLADCAVDCRKAARVLTAARELLASDPYAQPLAYGRAIHALTEALAACDTEPAPTKAEPANTVRCDNCSWKGTEDKLRCTLDTTPNLNERLDPGGEVPVGECPRCGCLAYIA